MKKLCTGRVMNQIPSAMQQYCKAAGKTLPGLQRRRKAEAALYNKKVESRTGATTTTVKESEDYSMNTIKKAARENQSRYGRSSSVRRQTAILAAEQRTQQRPGRRIMD